LLFHSTINVPSAVTSLEVEDRFDEEALAAMHDWWNYNREVISARGNYR